MKTFLLSCVLLALMVSPCPADDAHMLSFKNMEDPREFIEGTNDIDSYTAVGWWLMQNDRIPEALTLINEGIRNNPEAFQLHYVRGQLYLKKARELTFGNLSDAEPEALVELDVALKAYTQAATLGLQERTETRGTTWSLYKEQDILGAVRMSVLMEKRIGDPELARARGLEFNRLIGGDSVLERNMD